MPSATHPTDRRQECCEPYHSGAATPAGVEAALRARFCAFVRGKDEYVIDTFHPQYHCFKYGVDEPGARRGAWHAAGLNAWASSPAS